MTAVTGYLRRVRRIFAMLTAILLIFGDRAPACRMGALLDFCISHSFPFRSRGRRSSLSSRASLIYLAEKSFSEAMHVKLLGLLALSQFFFQAPEEILGLRISGLQLQRPLKLCSRLCPIGLEQEMISARKQVRAGVGRS